jgi:hypothetical protein
MHHKTRGVSGCGLAIYVRKYLKEKEELTENQISHHAKISSSKNPSRYYDSITNLKFQHKLKRRRRHRVSSLKISLEISEREE